MGEGAAEPALLEKAEHRGQRMGEGPELPPEQPRTRFWVAINKRETALRGG
jgi:hypothetical protein